MLKIGRTIAALREKANMTQEQLAAALYVSRELVSKWETDKSAPDYRMIARLAALFSVDTDVLFDKEQTFAQELAPCVPEGRSPTPFELQTAVNAFLSILSVRDRAVFLRRYYYFEDVSEIAAACGVGEGYVRTILMRARKKLKDYLKGALL